MICTEMAILTLSPALSPFAVSLFTTTNFLSFEFTAPRNNCDGGRGSVTPPLPPPPRPPSPAAVALEPQPQNNNNKRRSPARQSVENLSSQFGGSCSVVGEEATRQTETDLRVGNRVVCIYDESGGPEFGTVRWIGNIPGEHNYLAGVEFVSVSTWYFFFLLSIVCYPSNV